MKLADSWVAVWATMATLAAYELALLALQSRSPNRLARTAHAMLRQDWFEALSQQAGTEILAVQTLRNSLMSATMLASTAALGLMGTVTLAVPALHAGFETASIGPPVVTPRLLLELSLLTLLFSALVCTLMSVRFFNHAGYISSMSVGSRQRERWNAAGASHLRKAGLLYSWGLRQLVLVVPVVAATLLPAAGPVAAVLVVGVLFSFDKIPAAEDVA